MELMMDWTMLLNRERPRVSTNPGDHRAEFERDYDRTVFSTPVKRLQDKAQVFPLEPHDAVRTRLTHSLEVSSVARGVGMRVAQWLTKEHIIEEKQERWIEAIAATCGLIHDLGNPPFGHAGEDAIRYWFETRFTNQELRNLLGGKGDLTHDFLLFEGNAQTLRILTKLQILADYNGLNLTYGTLSASCKYLAAAHEVGENHDHAYEKPGYFNSERKVMENIRDKTGTGNSRNPITFLVEAADDIVYSVADIEDGIKKGILSWKNVEAELREYDDSSTTAALKTMETILRAGTANIPDNLPDDIYASAFRTASIGRMVESVTEEFKKNYEAIMNGTCHSELVKGCDAARLVEGLKQLGRTKVYCTPPTLKLEIMGRRVITELMDIFWEGAQTIPEDRAPKTKDFSGKVGALLSENYRRVFHHFVAEDKDLPVMYHRFQLVTDYVCGMTDSFAKRLHSELCNAA